jgi:hypothetical protein
MKYFKAKREGEISVVEFAVTEKAMPIKKDPFY